mmetsp:Transcript_20747/g.51884  ORF Transcript_20747/g.51884 Transcript_20747/m.51884 type:complete len:220 (-) Transcript_20747:610-1269(-)
MRPQQSAGQTSQTPRTSRRIPREQRVLVRGSHRRCSRLALLQALVPAGQTWRTQTRSSFRLMGRLQKSWLRMPLLRRPTTRSRPRERPSPSLQRLLAAAAGAAALLPRRPQRRRVALPRARSMERRAARKSGAKRVRGWRLQQPLQQQQQRSRRVRPAVARRPGGLPRPPRRNGGRRRSGVPRHLRGGTRRQLIGGAAPMAQRKIGGRSSLGRPKAPPR